MDITMCSGLNCDLKENCLRFKAKASEYQSYFMQTPYEIKDGVTECEFFIEYIKPENDVIRK